MPPGSAQAETNCESLGSSYQIAPGRSQAVANLGLHGSPFQGVPEPTRLEAGIKTQ